MLSQTDRDIAELTEMLQERGAHEHGRLQTLRGEFLMRRNMLKSGKKRPIDVRNGGSGKSLVPLVS